MNKKIIDGRERYKMKFKIGDVVTGRRNNPDLACANVRKGIVTDVVDSSCVGDVGTYIIRVVESYCTGASSQIGETFTGCRGKDYELYTGSLIESATLKTVAAKALKFKVGDYVCGTNRGYVATSVNADMVKGVVTDVHSVSNRPDKTFPDDFLTIKVLEHRVHKEFEGSEIQMCLPINYRLIDPDLTDIVSDLKWTNTYVFPIMKKLLQGEMAYIVSKDGTLNGWYQKLRDREAKSVSYYKISGSNVVKHLDASETDTHNNSSIQILLTVTSPEKVVKFISSGFRDESCVDNTSNYGLLEEIRCHEEAINILKSKLK